MAYNVYITEGLVLRTRPERESDLSVQLLTQKYGRLFATARGIRQPASKLRGSLQRAAWGRFGLIRTKRGWQIINSLGDGTWWDFSPAQSLVVERLLGLLTRVLPVEEADDELFLRLYNWLDKLQQLDNQATIADFELQVKLIILSHLGYVDLEQTPLEIEPTLAGAKRNNYRQLIEQALEYSHL